MVISVTCLKGEYEDFATEIGGAVFAEVESEVRRTNENT
jgi:hypothetical protein